MEEVQEFIAEKLKNLLQRGSNNETVIQVQSYIRLEIIKMGRTTPHAVGTCSFARRSWRARVLFLSCVLSSVQKMRIPVGLRKRSTAVSTLLTF